MKTQLRTTTTAVNLDNNILIKLIHCSQTQMTSEYM